MGKPQLKVEKVNTIVALRQKGYSLHEIAREVHCAPSTVHRYIDGVTIKKKYRDLLRAKQGGSTYRSKKMWNDEMAVARDSIEKLSDRDSLFLLVGLYWGEGTKRELNLINGDAKLVRVFLHGLYTLGVHKQDVRLSIRVYGNENIQKCQSFWLSQLNLDTKNISGYEILPAVGINRLPYGMCRVRVSKSQRFFKRIICMIHLLGDHKELSSR